MGTHGTYTTMLEFVRATPNKSLKDAALRLDSFSQRMLRILRADFRCSLALR